MNIIDEIPLKDNERREKRLIVPIIYLLAEITVFWLVLSLIQLKFDLLEWSVWAIIIFILGIVYSIIKTVHIYERQKDYKKSKYKI